MADLCGRHPLRLGTAPVLQTCHRDLWADHVLPTGDGGVCVIDWENSGPADPSHELACVLFDFARGDAGRARVLMRTYNVRWAGRRGSARALLDARCAAWAHHPSPPRPIGSPPTVAPPIEPTPPRGSARYSMNHTPTICSNTSWLRCTGPQARREPSPPAHASTLADRGVARSPSARCRHPHMTRIARSCRHALSNARHYGASGRPAAGGANPAANGAPG